MPKRGPKVWRALLPGLRRDLDDNTLDVDDINEGVLDKAAEAIGEGGVGVLPTETVYGLVGRADRDEIFERIYGIKGRPKKNPLPVQVLGLPEARMLGLRFTEDALVLARNFWPGPLTLILPFTGECPFPVAPKLLEQWRKNGSVGVRVPDHIVARRVLTKVGMPIIATSANLSMESPVTHAKRLSGELRRQVDWIVDAGPTTFGQESTVIRCDDKGWKILREGALRGATVQRVL